MRGLCSHLSSHLYLFVSLWASLSSLKAPVPFPSWTWQGVFLEYSLFSPTYCHPSDFSSNDASLEKPNASLPTLPAATTRLGFHVKCS